MNKLAKATSDEDAPNKSFTFVYTTKLLVAPPPRAPFFLASQRNNQNTKKGRREGGGFVSFLLRTSRNYSRNLYTKKLQ